MRKWLILALVFGLGLVFCGCAENNDKMAMGGDQACSKCPQKCGDKPCPDKCKCPKCADCPKKASCCPDAKGKGDVQPAEKKPCEKKACDKKPCEKKACAKPCPEKK